MIWVVMAVPPEGFNQGLSSLVDKSPSRKSAFANKENEKLFDLLYVEYASAVNHYNKTFNEKRQTLSKAELVKPFEIKK